MLTSTGEGTDLEETMMGQCWPEKSLLVAAEALHAHGDVHLHVDGLVDAADDRRAVLRGAAGAAKDDEQGLGSEGDSAPIAWEVKLACRMWPTAHIEQKATRS